MDIQLNSINRSNDQNNSQIVIFQKNVASGYNELAVAWKQVQNCGLDDPHSFVYPVTKMVAAGDGWSNYSPEIDAQPGDRSAVTVGKLSSPNKLGEEDPTKGGGEVG